MRQCNCPEKPSPPQIATNIRNSPLHPNWSRGLLLVRSFGQTTVFCKCYFDGLRHAKYLILVCAHVMIHQIPNIDHDSLYTLVCFIVAFPIAACFADIAKDCREPEWVLFSAIWHQESIIDGHSTTVLPDKAFLRCNVFTVGDLLVDRSRFRQVIVAQLSRQKSKIFIMN